ncbi:MAG: efflux RND transporter periplasmic adaptor subunit [Verrucomicrobia bacterium]|nr:efflux RND transporter periplasmic adaptor subunit [Verrucomicrobiota bacterium]
MNPFVQHITRRWVYFRQNPRLAMAGGAVTLILLVGLLLRPSGETKELSFYEVKRGDFLISLVEGGTVEALNEVVIRSEVEGTARIIYIIPEGSYVKKGELLVELDSSAAQDSVNQQLIAVEKAQFALVQAEQQLAIQKSTVESEVQAAELKVEFAQTDLDKYEKGEARQLLRNAQMQTNTVFENLKISEERLEWSKKLFEKGFETKGNLDRDSLAVTQARMNLEQAQEELRMLEVFDHPKKLRTLQAALQEAKDNLDRVKLQGERRLSQFTADVASQKRTLELSQKKLERDQKQLLAAKILAPQGGLVVYATGGNRFSNESLIEEGAVVRNRQELIKLPDISAMKLQVKIHESHINNVRRGQAAFVVLDSLPDRRFAGHVSKVAPLPDSSSRWGNPNLKVYATEILITDPLPDTKPGVSARAEIIVTNLPSVVTVPIQSVTTRKGKQVVFLASNPTQPVPVEVGLYNTKFIEVTRGLDPGDRVLLSPPFDTEEKDLGGGIIGQGDPIPTNRPAPVTPNEERRSNPRPTTPAGRDGSERSPRSESTGTESGSPSSPVGASATGNGVPQFDTDNGSPLGEPKRAPQSNRPGRERRNTAPSKSEADPER